MGCGAQIKAVSNMRLASTVFMGLQVRAMHRQVRNIRVTNLGDSSLAATGDQLIAVPAGFSDAPGTIAGVWIGNPSLWIVT
jgi:hypothetical protein